MKRFPRRPVLWFLAGAASFTGVFGPPCPPLLAQPAGWSSGSIGLGLLLRRLDGVKRVLMVGAHPDDEDTALLTALARGMGAEAAYLSLTRGEGGQNLVGPELDEGLGLVRTGELLAARSLDGARQYFTRAFDFGFSRSADETFRLWPRDEVLADVVWVIRTFRPQVVVSVFSGTTADGHGHHQAAGILALEAFRAASDPARFPEQLALGARPWAPAALYRLVRRNLQEATTSVETGVLDPLLGRSWYQVAMDSRSQHRSQDMGVAQPLGSRRSHLALVEARVGVETDGGLFSGVDTSLVSLARGVGEPRATTLAQRLEAYRTFLGEARRRLSLEAPWEALDPLAQALVALEQARALLGGGGEVGSGPPAALLLETALDERIPQLRQALLQAAGVVVDVRLDQNILVPGEEAEGVVEVWNGGSFPVEVMELVLEGRVVGAPQGLDGSGGPLPPGALLQRRFQVRVPTEAPTSVPYFLVREKDGELYRWPADPAVWGLPYGPPPLGVRLGLRLEGVGEVRVNQEGRYRGVDKARGEYVEPPLVVPALSVVLEPASQVLNPADGGTLTFRARVRSWGREGREGILALELPSGWQASPPQVPFRLVGAGEEVEGTFEVRTRAVKAGDRVVVGALARTSRGEVFRQGITLVDYPHIPRALLPAEARGVVVGVPVAFPQGLRVGYVMGSGDMGAEVLRQLGARVELLGPEAVLAGAYESFHTVVLGIRAYETRPDLRAANAKLLDFARRGGTVVVQYNKYEYPQGGFAPFPVEMSRPHDRVTDEEAPVTLLDPEHPLLRAPNRIGPEDFDGWVQERGLYFLSRWDPAFTPLLEMSDPGQPPLRGGLLVARVGEGAYVYTGLALFRQFPEGVPGAYRLFANLVALRGRDLPPSGAADSVQDAGMFPRLTNPGGHGERVRAFPLLRGGPSP